MEGQRTVSLSEPFSYTLSRRFSNAVSSHFAAVGGLAIILSLGFDPFVQNLLHYVPDLIDSPSQASLLGTTSRYNTASPLIGAAC
jgi:hypothetical protein